MPILTDQDIGLDTGAAPATFSSAAAPHPSSRGLSDYEIGLPMPQFNVKPPPGFASLDQYQNAANQFDAGQNSSDFLSAIASPTTGLAATVPAAASKALGYVGNVARAIPSDVAQTLEGQEKYYNLQNLAAAALGDRTLPVDVPISEASQSAPYSAALAKTGEQTAANAPLFALSEANTPEFASKLMGYGFGGLAAKSGLDSARILDQQLNLPPQQRDSGQIADALSNLAQAGIFGGLGAAHLGGKIINAPVKPDVAAPLTTADLASIQDALRANQIVPGGISGAKLEPMQPSGAVPAQAPTTGAIPFKGISDELLASKPPPVAVPATPPEPERDINILQEIRQKGITTRNGVKQLYPDANLSNEDASTLVKQAYPEGIPSEETVTRPVPQETAVSSEMPQEMSPAEALNGLPPPPAGTVRVFQGSGAPEGAGSDPRFFTRDITRAASYGPDVSYVDVPQSVFYDGQRQISNMGQAPGQDTILPEQFQKESTTLPVKVVNKTEELEDLPENEGITEPAVAQNGLSAAQIFNLPPDEFAAWNKSQISNGAAENPAYRLGRSMTSPEQITGLSKFARLAENNARGLLSRYKKTGDPMDANMASIAGSRANFFRKAHEAATGTGSAGFELRRAAENTPQTATATARPSEVPASTESEPVTVKGKTPQRVQLKGKPQTYEVMERLPQSAVEKENGEQSVLIRNERTGKTQVVPESQTRQIRSGTTGDETAEKEAEPAETGGEKEPDLVGLGGALHGEVETGAGEDITGIAHGVREEIAQTGRQPSIPRGEGTSESAMLQRGRRLIDEGVDPEAMMTRVENNGYRFNRDDMALARVHLMDLEKQARQIESKFGTNSQEYLDANKAVENWNRRTKPMQTEWHAIGEAQQGATDIDTGDLVSMESGFQKATGKSFTPSQRTQAVKLVEKVQQTRAAAEPAAKHLAEQFELELGNVSNPVPDSPGEAQKMFSQIGDAHRSLAGFKFGSKLSLEQVKFIWGYAKKFYIDRDHFDLDDIAGKVSSDLGIPAADVKKAFASRKTLQSAMQANYLQQARVRQIQQAAKFWLEQQKYPGIERFMRKIPRWLFSEKFIGHAPVGIGTHAAQNLFIPERWPMVLDAYCRMWVYGYGKSGNYESAMRDLTNRPNFPLAKKSGCMVDPFQQVGEHPSMNPFLNRVFGNAAHAFDALKNLRMDLFDHFHSKLPASILEDEDEHLKAARFISDMVNHATGTDRIGLSRNAMINALWLAPRLLKSRFQWLVGDPARALYHGGRAAFGKASPAEKMFAFQQLKEKGTALAVYYAALQVNQGILKWTGSNQQINFTDPSRPDWLRFKGFGYEAGPFSPGVFAIRQMARFMGDVFGTRTKFQQLESRQNQAYGQLGEYARGEVSPVVGIGLDQLFREDYMGRPLPDSNERAPSWMRKRGIYKYTWLQYGSETAAPIFLEEPIREAWQQQDMPVKDQHWLMKTLIEAGTRAATGIYVGKDDSIGQR